MVKYVLDTNFFIQAHRMHYPMDVMPSFWERLCDLANKGAIMSIDKVGNELNKNEDDLSNWCRTQLDPQFFADTRSVIHCYQELVQWAASREDHYHPTAIAEFLDADEADAWLAAFVLQDPEHFVIVTHETSQPGRKNKIKLPDVCSPFGLQYVNTIELFRRLRVKF